jgi:hypothetical protein
MRKLVVESLNERKIPHDSKNIWLEKLKEDMHAE